MVNSGAIMSASILLYLLRPEMNMAQKYDYVHDFFKVFRESKIELRNQGLPRKKRVKNFRPTSVARREGESQKPAARD